MTDMLMALQRGDIVVLETDQNTVRYIASRNENIVDRPPYLNPNNLLFSMLLREEDAELRDRLSACIAEMKEDGTMEDLRQRYVEDVIAGKEPDAIVPEIFPDAGTIKVAVTGDRPPMDYVSAGGEPLGFNTALITEIAKRLGINVEFINVTCAARGRKHHCDRALYVRFPVVGCPRRLPGGERIPGSVTVAVNSWIYCPCCQDVLVESATKLISDGCVTGITESLLFLIL